MKTAPNVINVTPRRPLQQQHTMPLRSRIAPVDVAEDIVASAHPHDTTYDNATKAIKHVALSAVRRVFAKVIAKSFENGNTSQHASLVLARGAEREIQEIEKGLNGLIQTHEPNANDPNLVKLHSAYQTQRSIVIELQLRQKQLSKLKQSDTITVQALKNVRTDIARITQSLQATLAAINGLQEQHASGENVLVLPDGTGFGTPAHVAGAINKMHTSGKALLEDWIGKLTSMNLDDNTKQKMLKELSMDLDKVVFDVLSKLSH
jgi:DNA-directed RNA polymerase subunit H (RpoH/RPB5)